MKHFSDAQNATMHQTNHQRKHTNTRPFKCSHCNYAANFQECLREHVKRHATNRLWKFSCDLCSFKTDTKNIFKSHETIHTGELPLSCALCDYRCRFKRGLRGHVFRKHCDDKPFKCPHCVYQAAAKFILTEHIRNSHTLNKERLRCQYCTFDTVYKNNLKVHIKRKHKNA